MEKLKTKVITITTTKLPCDDQSFSSVYDSIEEDRIPRKKKKRKYEKIQLHGIK